MTDESPMGMGYWKGLAHVVRLIRRVDERLRPLRGDPGDWGALFRARCLIAMILALPLPVLLIFGVNRASGRPLDPLELGAFASTAGFFLVLPLIRAGRLRLAGNLAVGLGLVLGFLAAASSGGSAQLPLLGAIVLPLVAFFVVGIRSGLAWSLVSAACLLALGAAIDAGTILPRPLSPEVQLRERFAAPLLQLLVLSLLGLSYEHFRRRQESRIDDNLARLARNERQFRAVFDEAAVGVVLLDVEGCVLELNRYGSDFLPLVRGDDFIGRLREWGALARSDREPEAPETLIRRLEKGSHEICLRSPTGQLEWVSGSLSYVRDDRGEIELGVAVLRRVTEQKRAEDQMRQMAYFDSLTGLPNRAFFWERFRRAVAAARADRRSVGLIFIDLDGFKDINDRYGHEAGDEVLSATALRLKASVRGADEILSSQLLEEDWNGVSRLGGDEFTVLLSEVDGAEGARVVCERILAALMEPIPWRGDEFRVRASIGVALLPEHAANEEELLHLADQAMYEEKRSGRCGYRFA